MLNFFIGVLVGAIIIDFMWAWQLGVPQRITQDILLKIKIWRASKLWRHPRLEGFVLRVGTAIKTKLKHGRRDKLEARKKNTLKSINGF